MTRRNFFPFHAFIGKNSLYLQPIRKRKSHLFKEDRMMKRILLFMIVLTSLLSAKAQVGKADSTTFKGYIYNAEYQVYIQMDFYHNAVVIPGQELFGQLPGYFGAKRDTRKWPFVAAKITSPTSATLSVTNDYGSEDLEATLTYEGNGEYILHQGEGSTIKIAVNRKWVKIPKTLVLKRQ
jgi:hypothetical protein